MFEWLILGGIVAAFGGNIAYESLKERKQQKLLASQDEERRKLLENLSATVFVREPNGAKSNLEFHLEQELISRGARVLISNQQAGMAIVKQGQFTPLHAEAHISFVGTLRVTDGIMTEVEEWTEKEYDFSLRKEQHRVKMSKWVEKRDLVSHSYAGPKPILEPRGSKIIMVPATHYELSFRLIGRDGALLASGICERFLRSSFASTEDIFREIASEGVGYLDNSDVWTRIVIE